MVEPDRPKRGNKIRHRTEASVMPDNEGNNTDT